MATEDPWDWESILDLSGLDALPSANVDFEMDFDVDQQTSNSSTVPVSSDMKSSRDEEIPADICLQHGDPVDGGLNPYLPGSRAIPFANPNVQTNSALNYQNPSPYTLPATSDPVPSHNNDSSAWSNNLSSSSGQDMTLDPPSAPPASNTEVPNDLALNPPRSNVEPSLLHSHLQALRRPEPRSLPLAGNFRCPCCVQTFGSRADLE